MRKAIIVDANHLLNRTYHIPAFESFKSKVGDGYLATGATFGFIGSLKRMIEIHKDVDDYFVVVWDSGKGFRVDIDENYKGTRAAKTPEFNLQLDLTKHVLRLMGIMQCYRPNTEADDVIATLARRARLRNYKVLIISGDKDFNQLVSTHVNVLNPKGHNEYNLMTPESVQEHYGIPPRLFADYLALLGDSTDNVGGIDGVGKKTAAKLIQCNGSIEDMIAVNIHYDTDKAGNKKPVSKKLQEKINNSKEAMKLSKSLVVVKTDYDDMEVDCEKPNFIELKNFFKQYSFREYLNIFNEFVAILS